MSRKKLVCLLLSLSLFVLSCTACSKQEDILTVHFLDIGQGDCALLRAPQGDILIDAGPDSSEELLCLRLRELGVEELALAVLSHPDEDHIGGMDGVLATVPVQKIWINGTYPDSEAANRLLQAAKEQHTDVTAVYAGAYIDLGELRISVLHPFSDPIGVDSNEGSLALLVQYGKTRAIFTGDLGAEAEKTLIQTYGAANLQSDVYKVAHHGSSTSSSPAFLEAVKPSYAVISCSLDNSFGHPTGETLYNLEHIGATVLRTDRSREIVLISDGERFQTLDE